MPDPVAPRIAPDLGPRGESDKEILDEALAEMDEGLVWVEGQGWLFPEDA
jgi:hypothetical protein